MLTSVILMSNAVLTHFMNSGNNRFLELDFIQTGNRIAALLPADSLHLLPGWYMLFGIVDDIPSTAQIIQIEHGQTAVGSAEVKELTFSVIAFPNPATGQFDLQIQNPASDKFCSFQLFNISGRVVYTDVIADSSSDLIYHVITPSNLHDGVYILKVICGGTSIFRSLVIH